MKLPPKPILAGSSHADDGMDEADYDCCASSASLSKALQTLIPCMRAAAPNERSHQTAERSVTRMIDQAIKDQKELDQNARLEKRSLRESGIQPSRASGNLAR
ncbi:hypothetical protein AS026_01395 [Rhizobium altiplani]|uniref:Uncharacterized protein n=1 Tax=Rhizobium altiplani TaxID=1864509 RepID=A0A109J9G6_9HYPH|nr:hypothetical protein AS026_01395 [Rhizobium altiplani]